MGGLTASCFSAGLTIDALILWWWLTSAFTLSLIDYWYLVVEPKILYPSFCALLAESGGSAFVLLTDWSFVFVFSKPSYIIFRKPWGEGFCYWVCGAVFTGTSVADATIFASSYGLIYGYSCKFWGIQLNRHFPLSPFKFGLTHNQLLIVKPQGACSLRLLGFIY